MATLAIKFNHKAPKQSKEIKTEDDFKVGKRSDGAGGTMHVRNGKVVGHQLAVHQVAKLNEFRHAATEAAMKQAKASQEHHRPVQAEAPPRL